MKLMKFSSKLMHRASVHVWQFMSKYKLQSETEEYLLALSGGVDSIFLFHLFVNYKSCKKIKNFRCLHVNHQTRDSQIEEENFVRALCDKYDIDLIVEYGNFQNQQNFESSAREQRYKFFNKHLMKNEKLILGHHIDDSFEWSLMQSFRSANWKKTIGIPVRNGKIIRPLMCLTKKHIYRIANFETLKWKEDPTNELLSYERNYLRNIVIPLIAKKYPKYLKHYVYQSLQKIQLNEKRSMYSIQLNKMQEGIRLIYEDISKINREFIKNLIFELSASNRGSIEKQLDKLFEAIKNNKYGPISFSGGVFVYLDFKFLFLTNQKIQPEKRLTFNQFELLDCSQFKILLKAKIANSHQFRPPIVKVKREQFFGKDLVSKKEIPNFWSFDQNNTCVYESALRFLDKWSSKKSLKNRKLYVSLNQY